MRSERWHSSSVQVKPHATVRGAGGTTGRAVAVGTRPAGGRRANGMGQGPRHRLGARMPPLLEGGSRCRSDPSASELPVSAVEAAHGIFRVSFRVQVDRNGQGGDGFRCSPHVLESGLGNPAHLLHCFVVQDAHLPRREHAGRAAHSELRGCPATSKQAATLPGDWNVRQNVHAVILLFDACGRHPRHREAVHA